MAAYVFISFAADHFWKFLLTFQIFQLLNIFIHFIHRFIIFVSSVCHVHTFAKISQVLLMIFELSWLKFHFCFYFLPTNPSFWEAWPVKPGFDLASSKFREFNSSFQGHFRTNSNKFAIITVNVILENQSNSKEQLTNIHNKQ